MLKGTLQNSQVISGVQTASSNSAAIATGSFVSLIAYLNVSAVSGTTPSMAIKLQDSPDGVTWYDLPTGTFTAVTAPGLQRLQATNLGDFVRAVTTITGTAPSFTVDLQVAGI